ncbi:O-antigen ligase family protein [Spongisporangium articulatum]|uniref:O-antigen ligase family protein n=1 Tax=Spongisporangium articulatum TaxID=3362603 RepID=A0ABW8ANA3_9ACTN
MSALVATRPGALRGVTSSAGWYGGGALVAVGGGVLLGWQPLALVGVTVGLLVMRYTALAPVVVVVAEGTMLLARLVTGTYTVPTLAEFGACVLALAVLSVTQRDLISLRVYLTSLLVLAPWLIEGTIQESFGQAFTGLRITTFPVLAVAIGLSLSRNAFRFMMSAAAVIMAANGVASLYERAVGVEGLLAAGITYGDQVTEIGNHVLRAPGLMRNSFHLGLFSAAFVVLVMLSAVLAEERLSRWVYLVGLPGAAACLLLSTSRTSLVLVAVSALMCAVMSDPASRIGRASRVGAAVLLPVLPIGVALVGAGSTTSLFQRFGVWQDLFGSRLNLFGHGLGSVGAASFSQFSSADKVFVDNYWLSLAFQFGALVLLVVYLAFIALLIAVVTGRVPQGPARAMAAVLVSVGAASILLEVWEYPGAMALLGFGFGHWWALHRERAVGLIDDSRRT